MELRDLSADVHWIDDREEAPADPSTGLIQEGQGIVISLGNMYPQDDSTVRVSFFMSCGNLCAIGNVYVIEEIGGLWRVTGSTGPEVMS